MDLTQQHLQQCKVTSVLNKDTAQYGKGHMFNGDLESCWNSHQGSPQSVTLTFSAQVSITEVRIVFQGGFCGKTCQFLTSSQEKGELQVLKDFYPTDCNGEQVFQCAASDVRRLQVVFQDSMDFYGRVVVYSLKVIGSATDAAP